PSGPTAGTTSTSATEASATVVVVPSRTTPSGPATARTVVGNAASGAVDNGTARAPVASPVASRRSSAATCSAAVSARSSTDVVSTALPKNGTGATLRPSSSSTRAVSLEDTPWPPSSSGTGNPASPNSADNVRHSDMS